MHLRKDVGIIGGGAAGFFSAITAKSNFPYARVTIYEKSSHLLSKVKISGGGRCNVTHACFNNVQLSKYYPRGERQLRKAFEHFNPESTISWFQKRGVELVTLDNNCIFPKSNDSQTIIDCFIQEALMLGIEVKTNFPVNKIERTNDKQFIIWSGEKNEKADCVIVTTGGQPHISGLTWLLHKIVEPVPSLFTFNMPNEPVRNLLGIVVEQVTVKIEKTKIKADGPLLITHWGMSGPVVLELSAWGARFLADNKYSFFILINWLGNKSEEILREELKYVLLNHGNKMILNWNPFPFPNRLWEYLLSKTAIKTELRWKDLGSRSVNKLVNILLNDRYEVKGKTKFRDEFVTAGGISLDEVNFETMESKRIPGMFFAGEVLDIDGITGGFNFQAAWTTGWIAGKNCLKLM